MGSEIPSKPALMALRAAPVAALILAQLAVLPVSVAQPCTCPARSLEIQAASSLS